MSQKRWCQANPDYFHNRYGELKLWRERNPGYQKKKKRRRKRREIQDEIHLKHKYNKGVTSLFVHEIKDKIGFSQ